MAARKTKPAKKPAQRSESAFSHRLLQWFDRARRDLPWRRTRDPWAIWVSEVMLQQTRVEAVRASFERFVARYPTPKSFADASDDALMLAWKGLGYYRRARLLREGARAVVRDHRGTVPNDADALAELPGIGDYTRAAVASIAFEIPIAAVDGNVERVLARHLALRDDVGTAIGKRAIREAAAARLDHERPGDHNQAMMELGAMVCTPQSPRCGECPVAADCRGLAEGIAQQLPKKKPPRAPKLVDARVAVVHQDGCVLAFRIPQGEPNAGQWELPGPGALVSVEEGEFEPRTRDRCGARIEIGPSLAAVKHAITHHRITVTAHVGALRSRTAGELQPLPASDPEVAWTTISRKVFAAMRIDADG